VGQGLVQMPEIRENTHLKDLIGANSLVFFEQPLAECFLLDLPKVWAKVEDYKLFQTYVKKMQCTNDVTEKAFGMANSLHTLSLAPKIFDDKTKFMQIL